jgi:thioredoxin
MEIINEQNFNEKIASGVVLVDFFATWCGPCKMVAPILEKLAEQYEGRASIYKVDVDQSNALAAKFGVQAIPTMIVFKDGQPMKTHVGFAGAPQIEELLNAYL